MITSFPYASSLKVDKLPKSVMHGQYNARPMATLPPVRHQYHLTSINLNCLVTECAFSALTLLVGRQEGHPAWKQSEWWYVGVVMCQGADLHMAHLMPLPLTISCSGKSRLVLPFWYRLTWIVPDKIQEGRKMVVCVCVCGQTGLVSLGRQPV